LLEVLPTVKLSGSLGNCVFIQLWLPVFSDCRLSKTLGTGTFCTRWLKVLPSEVHRAVGQLHVRRRAPWTAQVELKRGGT
jgi:hypothetical protein